MNRHKLVTPFSGLMTVIGILTAMVVDQPCWEKRKDKDRCPLLSKSSPCSITSQRRIWQGGLWSQDLPPLAPTTSRETQTTATTKMGRGRAAREEPKAATPTAPSSSRIVKSSWTELTSCASQEIIKVLKEKLQHRRKPTIWLRIESWTQLNHWYWKLTIRILQEASLIRMEISLRHLEEHQNRYQSYRMPCIFQAKNSR